MSVPVPFCFPFLNVYHYMEPPPPEFFLTKQWVFQDFQAISTLGKSRVAADRVSVQGQGPWTPSWTRLPVLEGRLGGAGGW